MTQKIRRSVVCAVCTVCVVCGLLLAATSNANAQGVRIPGPGGASASTPTPALIQQKTNSASSGTSFTVVLDAAPTTGNVILLGYGCNVQTVASISQTGVTWTLVRQSNTNRDAEVWKGVVGSTPSATITINVSSGLGNTATAIAAEFSVITGTTDQTNVNTSASSANPATTNITTTVATAVIVACERNGSGSPTVTAGPTNSFFVLTSAQLNFQMAYRSVTSTGTYATDWTITAAGPWDTTIASVF